MPPKPDIDQDKCTGCSSCVGICPMGVFEIKDDKAIAINDECIGCRACEVQCPEKAIKIIEE